MTNKGGIDEIYNPSMKCTPKTKQIFKMEKFKRSTSLCSTQNLSENNSFVNPFGVLEEFNQSLRLFGDGLGGTMNLSSGMNKQVVPDVQMEMGDTVLHARQ